MIETLELHKSEIDDTPVCVRPRHSEQHVFERDRLPRQVLRFGLAGGLNTLVDLLILNGLLSSVLFWSTRRCGPMPRRWWPSPVPRSSPTWGCVCGSL